MTDLATTEKRSRMDEIAIVANHGPQLKTVADAWSVGQMYYNAKMVPKGVTSAAQLMIILMAGAELGLGPTAALRNIASFNGAALLHSDGPMMLVSRSGKLEWQRSGYGGEPGKDSYTAWFEAKRRDQETPVRREFSISMAKKAGLWGKSGPWSQYPDRMQFVRARAFVLRDLFGDVLGGIGILEEQESEAVVVEPTSRSEELLAALKGEPPTESEPVEVEVDGSDDFDEAEIHRAELREAGLFEEGA